MDGVMQRLKDPVGSRARVGRSVAVVLAATSLAWGCASTVGDTPADPAHRPEQRGDIVEAVRDLHVDWSPGHCLANPDGERCADWLGRVAAIREIADSARHDRFVQGQAVFALTRAGAFDRAHEIVDGCRVEGWWCSMLRGHVLAESQDVVAAEAAFDRMLEAMPESERCEWTDLSLILPGDAWDAYRSEDCRERTRRSETVWWLSDPSYLVPGNDAKVEHYNRMSWAALHDDQLEDDTGDGEVNNREGHSFQHHVTTLRRGMDPGRIDRRWRSRAGDDVSVIPHAEALLDPLAASPEDWELEAGRDDVAMKIDWGILEPIDAQVAFFERGDSVLATAAVDIPPSETFPEEEAHFGAGFVLRSDAESEPFIAATDRRRHRYVFRRAAPKGRYLVAVEARSIMGVGRTRFGHGLPHPEGAPVRLSDILLYAPGASGSVQSLPEALPLMRGGSRWSRDETLGIYLELYGPTEVTGYDVAVTLEPLGGGLFRKLADLVGLAGDDAVEVSWHQPTDAESFVVTLTIELESVEPGRYALTLAMTGPGLSSATVEKRIEVVERDVR